MIGVANRTGNRATSSWKASTTDFAIQRSPKRTRGAMSRTWGLGPRVSTDCLNSAILVSSQSRFPNSRGELTAAASTGASASCATL